MEYTQLGNTELKVSRFGLGCMRFPKDEKEAIEMVRYALDNGVNYLDTAYAYAESERIVGEAFKGGYREKAVVAAKCPVWAAESQSDFEKYLDKELMRMNTDCIDVYLLHDLNELHWEKVERYDGIGFLEKMVQKGKIRSKACSFHGTYEHFQKVLNAYQWDMIQIQLGILDSNNQAGVKGLKDATKKNISVVVMEPLRGGSLIKYAPPKVKQFIDSYKEKRSLVEWAFRYLYDMEEISVILSGTSHISELKENIRIFEDSKANIMRDEDKLLIEKIQEAFFENYAVACTGCKYCMPCPAGVNIPEIFSQYNMKKMVDQRIDKLLYQRNLVKTNTDASHCIECGNCESICPQGIAIIEELKNAHEALK